MLKYITMSLTRRELQNIFESALSNKSAFAVDWDFGCEDVAFNIKEIISSLDIDGKNAKQIHGKWIETVTIEGNEYQFDLESETKPVEVVKKANQHLKKIGKTFVFFDSMDDEYCFILINLSELPKYIEKGFIEL